jgi:hypothetical protein
MAEESAPARQATEGSALDRRSFLRTLGAGASAAVALHSLGKTSLATGAEACELGPQTAHHRQTTARDIRCEAAQLAYKRPYPDHVCNGEEDDSGGRRIANFSKGLPHNDLGEVDPHPYNALLTALASGDPADFAAIPRGVCRAFVSGAGGDRVLRIGDW